MYLHIHTISHSHSIANHNHTLSRTSLTINQLAKHGHDLTAFLRYGGESGYTKYIVGYGNATHPHTVGNKALTIGGSSASDGSGTLTSNGASTSNSGSAGSQNISVNVTQPYIVVNIWKRTA